MPSDPAVNFRHKRGALLLLALVPLFVDTARGDDPRLGAPDPFEAVDLTFRAAYAQGRAETLRKLDPIVIVQLDQLVLLRGGKRTEANAIPPLYHQLKAVAHVALGVHVALSPFGSGPIPAERLALLETLRNEADRADAAVDRAGFRPDHRERQHLILRNSIAFLDDVRARGRCERTDLLAFTRRMGPLVLANGGDAARLQIDAYHEIVSAWRRSMPDADWRRVRVLVIGSQMPRKHNVAVLYFAKLLGLSGESRRLVFAEDLRGEGDEPALNLLATHQLDRGIGTAFFDDPERMEIDLLGNAAANYLDTLDLATP